MSITVMKQALEALEYIDNNYMSLPKAGNEAITTLRTAIEQAERQETNQVTLTQTNIGIGERGMEAYEAAKERGWVGLSDERLMEMPKQEPVEYCTAYYCAGDCGQPHNQKEMQEFLGAQPEQEPVQVSPLEFVTMVMEKEHLIGKPLFWAEWPNKEKNT